MKRVHESVDYIKHRDCKQLHSLTEQLGSVGLRHDSLIDDIGQVKVREYRIVKDENGNKFTVYVVRVFSENAVWDVSRRYSDFFRLNDVLVGNGCSVPVLPPKQMFGVFSKDFLQKRRGSLEHYLQGVLHLLSQDSLRSFLWKSHILVSDLTTKKQEERKYQQHHHQQQQLDDDLLLTDFEHESLPQLSTSVDSAFEATQAFEQHEQNMNSDNNDDDSDGVGSINSGKSTDENDEKSGNNDGNNKNNKNKNESKPCLDDFEMVRVLGKGSFGKVMLCRKKGSGKLYAIKILKKQHVVKRKQVAHTKTERSVLGLVDHPFVVKLHYAFQTGDKLHFVLDFCSGGELFFHLGKAGKFTENLGKFYAAEIALALGHLHTKGVVYRDLKPENILLDHEGHIKLADFGLSKEGIVSGIKGTHSFCGTPEYLAPEVLNRTGHGTSVDWWSLGALLYEMLTGLPPWYSQDRQKMFASIRSSELRFPDCISIVARKILNAFLERDVRKRLGSVHDVEEVKAHEFFQSVQWEQLYNREIPSPFVPRLNSSTDTQNFDTQFTRMPINSIDASHFNMSPRMSSSMLSEGHPMFDGFTFVEPSNMDKQHQLATQQFNHHIARPNNTHALPPPTKFGTPSSPTSLSSTLLFE